MLGVTVKMELRFKMCLSFWRRSRSFQQNNNKNNHSTCFFLVWFLVVREAWLGTLCATHQRESSGEVSCLLSAVLMNTFAVAFIWLFHFDRFNWIKCTRARVARKVLNLLTWCTSLYMDSAVLTFHSCSQIKISMNELPVIESLCMRKDFRNRHGANIGSC